MKHRSSKLRIWVGVALGLGAAAVLAASSKSILEEWHLHRLDSKDEAVREAAAEALANLRSVRAIPRLLDVFRAPEDEPFDPYHYEGRGWGWVFKALEKIDGPPAIPVYIRLLKDADQYVRGYSALKLGELGPEATSAIPALLECLGDPKGTVRTYAARSLIELESASPLIVSALIGCLKDKDEWTRFSAKEFLKRMGPPAVTPLLSVRLEGDEGFRVHVLETLGLLLPADAASKAALVEAMEDPSCLVRVTGAHALSQVDPTHPGAVATLAAGLEAGDPKCREKAADLLRSAGGSLRALTALEKALQDPSRRVRNYSLSAIGELGAAAASAGPAILKAFRDPENDVRFAAFRASQKIGLDPLPTLLAVLDDPNPKLRALAAEFLEEIASVNLPPLTAEAKSSVKAALTRLSADPDPAVRKAAATAREGLGER